MYAGVALHELIKYCMILYVYMIVLNQPQPCQAAAGQARTAHSGFKSKVIHEMNTAESKFSFME